MKVKTARVREAAAILALAACSTSATEREGAPYDAGASAEADARSAQDGGSRPASEVFALMAPGETTSSIGTFAARSDVDGIAYRTGWAAIEPQDGNYDYAALDAAFDAVRAHNKRLTLHVAAAGRLVPAWLTGVATYQSAIPGRDAGGSTEPVPWDAVFLSRFAGMVAKVGAHIASRGDTALLRAASVGAPVAEMSMPACQNGVLGGTVPYSRATYLSAWGQTTKAYASAFSVPLFVSAPVDVICRPDDAKGFYTDVMTAAMADGGRWGVFAADLNAAGSARLGQVDTSISRRASEIGLQTIWSSTDDPSNRMAGTLESAVCKGLGAGARYFEIYKSDILSNDPAIQKAIALARGGKTCP